jgi:signal transduction histidine kinase/DNA-binding response OmpR family regulator
MAERRQKEEPPFQFLAGGGEMGALIRATDWSKTPIGPVEGWSQSLRMMVSLLLANRFPTLLWWGPEFCQLYNDAYRPILGAKHPQSMGQPGRLCWPEIWDIIGPLAETPFDGGSPTWMEDIFLEPNRHGFVEETHFTVAYSPVPDDTAPRGIGGVLATVHEITEKVVGERRLAALRDLGSRAGEAKTAEEACMIAAETLGNHAKDVPFALVYLIDPDGRRARLACAAGIAAGVDFSPVVAELADDAENRSGWPLSEVVRSAAMLVVDDLPACFHAIPPGPWSDPPSTAVLVPVRSSQAHQLAGVLVAGVSSRLNLDERYRSFLGLAAAQIATAVANARAYEEERRRAEALAEIDRAKTAFFSNTSHEFRTPLTLLLSPIEDLLLRSGNAPTIAADRAEIELMHRNGLRLLKLVNTLLDFSRIEAGRFEAVYEPVDLATLTIELASTFRSAMERAGLRYRVHCGQLPEPVYVARDMWEKIVLNLLSNAFKYTLEGEVAVRLAASAAGGEVELSVKDTGVGIPARELPRLFERFHRVEGQPGRTQEGTGIGLALVQELVRLHGGRVTVASAPGRGSAFTVAIPTGSAHLPANRIGGARTLAPTEIRAEAFVEEALRWLDIETGSGGIIESQPIDSAPAAAVSALGARPVVLLADDNADMRDYVRRLLADRYEVVTVANGEAALEEARRQRPDLILSDVMMPRLDGFGLLQAVRGEAGLREIPVILLSARAGEEARVEGMNAGADDYLTKPFAARELVARVGANLDMARLRRETAEVLRTRTVELETLIETVPAAVWFTNDPDASKVWGNRHAAALLRLSETANASVTAPEGERPGHFVVCRGGVEADPRTLPMQRAARGEEVHDDEIEIRFADGGSLTLLVNAAAVRDGAGKCVGAICAGIDITARKHAEASLRRFNETLEERVAAEIERRREAETALRQAQKMEAIGQLTGGIAHDMNNLLMVIRGNLEILERQLPPAADGGDRLRQPVQSALGGVERAAALTQRLLAFARRQPLDPKPVEPDRLVVGMSDMLRRTLGETIAIETRLAGGLWRTFADPNQLENAILNLAVNSRDAMPEGGELTLQTVNAYLDADDLGPHPEVSPGRYVLIAVTDTGTGMTREEVDKAFEPFFTTKDIGKGTGLGLSQVYGFVKQSGGHVEIESQPGVGTTVRIYLPRYPLGPDRQNDDDEAPAVPTGTTSECILVVEDDDGVRANNVGSLRGLGYRVIEARDGGVALRRLQGEPAIRLLFTDIGLPGGMNGRQLADAAQLLRPGLRVLFTTGYARDAIVYDGRIDSGITLIQKPFAHAALAAKVRLALDRDPSG